MTEVSSSFATACLLTDYRKETMLDEGKSGQDNVGKKEKLTIGSETVKRHYALILHFHLWPPFQQPPRRW
jgi:hypothetical protein